MKNIVISDKVLIVLLALFNPIIFTLFQSQGGIGFNYGILLIPALPGLGIVFMGNLFKKKYLNLFWVYLWSIVFLFLYFIAEHYLLNKEIGVELDIGGLLSSIIFLAIALLVGMYFGLGLKKIFETRLN